MCKPLSELPEGYMDYWVFKDLHLGIGKLKDVNPDIAEIQASYLLRDGLLFKSYDDILECKNEIIRILSTRKKHFSNLGDLYPDQVNEFVQHAMEDNLVLLHVEDVTQNLYLKYICDKEPNPQLQSMFDEMKEYLESVQFMIMNTTKKRITRLWKTAEKQRV